jgi:hypothetical protein
VQRKADRRTSAPPAQPLDAQQLGAARDADLRKVLAEIAVGHQPHELGTSPRSIGRVVT